MKSYDELTLEEKQKLVRRGIKKWKSNHRLYGLYKDVRGVAQQVLSDYNRKFYKRSYEITEPSYQQMDIEMVLYNLPEFDDINSTKSSK